QLLDLAAALVARARAVVPAGSTPPNSVEARGKPAIPVMIDLAEWSRPRTRKFALLGTVQRGPRDFAAWLLASMRERYRIPEEIGKAWLRENRLTLLLDGLDEVREADRERCVAEINALQTRWGVTRLAACSREADYSRLAVQLSLQGAVVIRPLTKEQVNAYFTAVSPRLAGVATALSADEELWELLTTPLMLNIMVLAQGDRTWQALSAEGDPAARRRLLFDAYVVEVLGRRRVHEVGGPERTLSAVRTLATASVRLDSGDRVTRLNADTTEHILDKSVGNIVGLWLFPMAFAIYLLASVAAMTIQFSTAAGAVVAIIGTFSLWIGILDYWPGKVTIANHLVLFAYIVPAAVPAVGLTLILRWLARTPEQSPPTIAVIAFGLALALAGGVLLFRKAYDEFARNVMIAIVLTGVATAAAVLLFGISPEALGGWVVGFGNGACLIACMSFWAGIPVASDGLTAATRRVLSTQLFLYPTAAIIVSIVWARSWTTPFLLPLIGWLVGVIYAFIPGMIAGIFLIGPVARVAMVVAGEPVPWRAAFLRFATDRSLLTFADGEYRFIHLLVRDHLAQCDPAQLAPAVLRRRAELAIAAPRRDTRNG
ncbi:MAG TPA: hypothetical protein VFB84_06650, partial [Micromonosporaceae bacterium]|nr:hypothetical protein [Micromonosporaceae bacterium]